jgi:serine/threonine-protein kinase
VESGETLGGRYRLISRLGTGGMSIVWLAADEVLDREVAVKVLIPRFASDPLLGPCLRSRIAAEARAVARLSHPHIVEVYDYGESETAGGHTLPYVIMERVSGRSFSHLLTGDALPWRVCALICAQVASALAAAHECGIVHRDVTPANVMITGVGVKLVDFGISALAGEADVGEDNQLLGTPAYLAPERLEEGRVDPAADVYALGLLLYRCLAGHAPWPVVSPLQALRAHRDLDPQPLPPIGGLPEEVAAVCLRCVARDPQERPTAAEAARVLGAAVGIEPGVPEVVRATVDLAVPSADVMTQTHPLTTAARLRTPWRRRLVVALGRD